MSPVSLNVVGRLDPHTSIAEITKSFASCLHKEHEVNVLETRPEAEAYDLGLSNVRVFRDFDQALSKADVSIFTDVTSNGPDDRNWEKTPATKVKYIYSVFDSTRVPTSWADIINNHFDAVFVPARFLIDAYRNSAVQKPIFYLPLALDLAAFQKLDSRKRGKGNFTFTFIGSREPRKNIESLIACFRDTFGARDDVQLRIHSALDFYNDPHFSRRINQAYQNIDYTTGPLSNQHLLDLIESSDCFISLSMGEGYSIVPRQFLAAGKPVILSDCLAHAEILSELRGLGDGLGFGVDSSIPVPAHYPHINGGGVFGLQYDTFKPSACFVLEHVFRIKDTLFSPDKIALRKEWASRYDINTLTPLYKSIVQPAFCRMSTGNELEYGGITTSDANLASRVSGKNFPLSGWQSVQDKPQKIVVIGNDGGFFSLFNRFASYLTWTLSGNPDSIVLPDWRVSSMQRHWRTSKFTSFCYGTPADGNVWLKLFKPLPYSKVDEAVYQTDQLLYRNSIVKDDYNEHDEPWLTYVHPYKLYRSPGFKRWRHWYHLYVNSHIHLQDHIKQEVDSIYESKMRGFRIISAHIRHPSHGIEQPGARMPTVELYCDHIRRLMQREMLNERNCRIFLATDQSSVVDKLHTNFGDMLVYSKDISRTTSVDDSRFNSLSKQEQMQEGHQIQHLTAANPQAWSTRMAEEVLIDTYLLARADYFIHVTSNIATAVSYLNPRLEMIYCE